MKGNQKQPEVGYFAHKSHRRTSQRMVRTMRDIPTQGKQLNQQTTTANHCKDETAEPCSRGSEGAIKHGSGKSESSPPGRATKVPVHDATVARNSFGKGSHRKAKFSNYSPNAVWGSFFPRVRTGDVPRSS